CHGRSLVSPQTTVCCCPACAARRTGGKAVVRNRHRVCARGAVKVPRPSVDRPGRTQPEEAVMTRTTHTPRRPRGPSLAGGAALALLPAVLAVSSVSSPAGADPAPPVLVGRAVLPYDTF